MQPLSTRESLAVLKFVLECSTWSALVACLASYSQYNAHFFSPNYWFCCVHFQATIMCVTDISWRNAKGQHICARTHTHTDKNKHLQHSLTDWGLVLGGAAVSVPLGCPRNDMVTAPMVQYGCLKKKNLNTDNSNGHAKMREGNLTERELEATNECYKREN